MVRYKIIKNKQVLVFTKSSVCAESEKCNDETPNDSVTPAAQPLRMTGVCLCVGGGRHQVPGLVQVTVFLKDQ